MKNLILVELKIVPFYAASQHLLGEGHWKGEKLYLKNIVRVFELVNQTQEQTPEGPATKFTTNIQYVPDKLYGVDIESLIGSDTWIRVREIKETEAQILKSYEQITMQERLAKSGLVAPPPRKIDAHAVTREFFKRFAHWVMGNERDEWKQLNLFTSKVR